MGEGAYISGDLLQGRNGGKCEWIEGVVVLDGCFDVLDHVLDERLEDAVFATSEDLPQELEGHGVGFVLLGANRYRRLGAGRQRGGRRGTAGRRGAAGRGLHIDGAVKTSNIVSRTKNIAKIFVNERKENGKKMVRKW
jgi:hypothetical protein